MSVSAGHSCSYFCENPDCIRAQRDGLRELLIARNDDARRYRFLRSQESGETGVVQRELWAELAYKLCREEAMDREVDAAIRLLKWDEA